MKLYFCGIAAVLFCISLYGCGGRDERHYELALRYKESGDYDKAIEELQYAVKANPRFAKAFNQLGITYGKVGLYEKAVDQCRRAVEIDPEFASAYYNLGVIYQTNLGKPVEALSAYTRYLELRPEGQRADAVRIIARSLMERPDVRSAMSESAEAHLETARRRAEEGEFAGAIEAYEKVLARAPRTSSRVHLEMASIYEKNLGKPEEALAHLRHYLDKNINAPDAAEVMAAIGKLREKVTRDPTPKEVPRDTLREAEELIEKKELSRAMEILEEALNDAPDNEHIHDLLAESYMSSGDLKGAEKEFEWLRSRQADFAYDRELENIYSTLAHSDLERGENAKAEERLLKALELAPRNGALRWKLARSLAGQGKFQRAMEEAAAARAQLRGGVGDGEMAALYLEYARHLAAGGQYESALESFKEVKALKPSLDLSTDMAVICEGRARLAQENGRLALAEKEYLKALQLEPKRRQVHEKLAALYEQMGHYDKALGEWGKVAEGGKDGSSAYREIARIHETYKADGAKALVYYRRYLEAEPEAPDVAEVEKKLKAAKQEEEKLVEYERAARRKPSNATTHYNLAVLLQRQGKLREAIKEYRATIAIEPQNAQAHFNLGYSYDRLRMFDEAIKQYREAIQYKPDYVKAYNNLAAIYKMKGWYGKAIASFKRALQTDPTYAHAHLGLGAIYADELKDRDKARYHYEQYLQLQPQGTYAPQVRAWLKGAR